MYDNNNVNRKNISPSSAIVLISYLQILGNEEIREKKTKKKNGQTNEKKTLEK